MLGVSASASGSSLRGRRAAIAAAATPVSGWQRRRAVSVAAAAPAGAKKAAAPPPPAGRRPKPRPSGGAGGAKPRPSSGGGGGGASGGGGPPLNCPHFGACSGCSVERGLGSPPAADAARAFFAARGVPSLPVSLGPVHGWRQRAKLAVRGTPGRAVVGLFRAGSHEAVDIPGCVIHHPAINAAAALLRQIANAMKARPGGGGGGALGWGPAQGRCRAGGRRRQAAGCGGEGRTPRTLFF